MHITITGRLGEASKQVDKCKKTFLNLTDPQVSLPTQARTFKYMPGSPNPVYTCTVVQKYKVSLVLFPQGLKKLTGYQA